MERRTRFHIAYVVFAVVAMIFIQEAWQRAQTIEVVPYSEFEKLLKEKKIEEVVISDQRITGKFTEKEGGKTVAVANLVPPELADRLDKYGVKYTRVFESTVLRDVLSWVLPALIFFGVWYLLARRMRQRMGGMGGGVTSIGKSRAKIYVEH
jgi:cell division protease FtsH